MMGTVKCTGQVSSASPMAIEPQGARRRTHAGPTPKVMFAHRFVKTQRKLAPVACRHGVMVNAHHSCCLKQI